MSIRSDEIGVMEDISEEIERLTRSLGAEVYGVASAVEYEAMFPDKPKPAAFVKDAKSVIVFGLPFEPGTITSVLNPGLAGLKRKAAEGVTASNAQPIGAERYFLEEENAMLSREVQLIGYQVAKRLRNLGYLAFYLPPSKQDTRFRTAPFYHTPAMYLAGMGTLGLNCSILTPEFGPRVWVTSVITDCRLSCGKPMAEEMCTRCNLCVDNCPIDALDGKGWKNPFACASYGCCSTCIAICPVGKV